MSEKSAEQLYEEREARVLAAAKCQPRRPIPVFGPYQKYPYHFAGVTFKEAMNDYAVARAACHKFLDYFQPDVDFGPIFAYPAKAMETLRLEGLQVAGPRAGRRRHVPVRRRRVHDGRRVRRVHL